MHSESGLLLFDDGGPCFGLGRAGTYGWYPKGPKYPNTGDAGLLRWDS